MPVRFADPQQTTVKLYSIGNRHVIFLQTPAFTTAPVRTRLVRTNVAVRQPRQARNVNWRKQRAIPNHAMERTCAPCLRGHLADSNA